MTQHDRDATPMYRLFQAKPNMWTYSARPETVDLTAVNPATGPLAKASLELDFSGVDRAGHVAMRRARLRGLVPYRPLGRPYITAAQIRRPLKFYGELAAQCVHPQ